MGRHRPALGAIVAALALVAAGCGSAREGGAEPRIELDGVGGEVWGFERLVTGVADRACREVWVESPAGEVVASTNGEGRFGALSPLVEGENEVRAVCRDAEGLETRSEAVPFVVMLSARPVARIRLAAADREVLLDSGASEPGPRGAPLVRTAWTARPGNPAELRAPGGEPVGWPAARETLALATPELDGEYYVTLEVEDELGATDRSTVLFRVLGGEPLALDTSTESAAWIEGAVVYGVVPHLFGAEGLRAVTARLDDLSDLGVSALWLSPIFPSPEGDYGYAVVDHFGVRPALGTPDDLRELVDEAHRRGLRVVLDFVPNHTSDEHPWFLAAEEHGEASAQWGYYDRDGSGAPTHYFDWENLPNLELGNPEVRRFVLEAFSYWVREFDVDGFRVDVAWGVAERAPGLWPEWRRELLRIKPDLLLVAEASARSPYYFRNGFDVAYDWTGQLGEWAWSGVFEAGAETTALLHSALTAQGEGFPDESLVLRFLNNNDTGPRFVTRHGPELLVPATTLLLTLPGLPCLFTGDEVGAEFEPYGQLEPLELDGAPELRELHRTLVALRSERAALRGREWIPVEAEPASQVYAFLRPGPGDEASVLVVLSFSGSPVEAALALPPEHRGELAGPVLYDLLADEQVLLTDSGAVPVPPWTGLVLVATD